MVVTSKCTTPKALQINMKQQGTIINNNGVGDSSFRVLYYGKSSAGSIPFMWESHPGTPKHATTESSLPPLTPPPAYHQSNQMYNPLKHTTTSLRTLFLSTSTSTSKTTWSTSDYSTTSYDSSPKQSSTTSLRSLFLDSTSRKSHVAAAASVSYSLPSTPVSKGQVKSEFRWKPTSIMCFGGGFNKAYKMKNVLISIGNRGKKKKIN